MKVVEREQLDWTIVVIIILVVGFLLVLVAGQLALRFSPGWELNASMDSHIDPNSTFVAGRPDGFIEPVDASILTESGWADFLTPGVTIITGTPFPPTTSTPSSAPTTASSATSTATVAASPTNTFVFIPWTQTSTRKPKPTEPVDAVADFHDDSIKEDARPTWRRTLIIDQVKIAISIRYQINTQRERAAGRQEIHNSVRRCPDFRRGRIGWNRDGGLRNGWCSGNS